MKIIYHFYSEDALPFECEAMFDEGIIIDAWSCNDATWRNEYFSGLMSYLDVQVKPLPKKYHKNAIKQIRQVFGFRECFDDDSDNKAALGT